MTKTELQQAMEERQSAIEKWKTAEQIVAAARADAEASTEQAGIAIQRAKDDAQRTAEAAITPMKLKIVDLEASWYRTT